MADVNPTSFLTAAPSYDPLGVAQKVQNLSRSNIENEQSYQQLQLSKIQNVQRIIGGLLSDPNSKPADAIKLLDQNNNGVFGSNPAVLNQAKAALQGLDPNDSASFHQHLLTGMSSLLDGAQQLQAYSNKPGPILNQGSQLQPTVESGLGTLRSGQLSPSGNPVEVGRTPAEMMTPTTVKIQGPDGIWRDQPATQGQAGSILNPGGSQRYDNPAPMGRGVLNGPPPQIKTGLGFVSPSPSTVGGGRPYISGPGPASPIVSPPQTVAQPTSSNSSVNPALAAPIDTGDQVIAGNKQRNDDLESINSEQYKLQKQGLYTVANIVKDPKFWSGTAESRFATVRGALNTIGLLGPDGQNIDANNATAVHALAQAVGVKDTDAKTLIQQMAGGSLETAKPALQELIHSRLGEKLSTEAAIRENKDTPAQGYVSGKTASTTKYDPLAAKFYTMDPTQQAAFAKTVSATRFNKILKDANTMHDNGLVTPPTGSPPLSTGK